MRRATRILIVLVLVAVLVPLLPLVLFGSRIDRIVAGWLDPPPPPGMLAALEVGVLAADILLPVPSSVVATYGGARLGVPVGTVCAWAGMTAGAIVGWWLGRRAGSRALERLEAADRAAVERGIERLGPLVIVLARPLPLLAEATALAAGGGGMPLATFLPAAAAGNAVIALAWTALGVVGGDNDALPIAMLVALVTPVAAVWWIARTRRADRP